MKKNEFKKMMKKENKAFKNYYVYEMILILLLAIIVIPNIILTINNMIPFNITIINIILIIIVALPIIVLDIKNDLDIKNIHQYYLKEKKIPASIAPDFHPGMIVITMRPLWCIYLPGRYTNTSQCINGKYRFLSASSVSSAVYGKCRQGTIICTMIGSLLCTPVVHLQGSFPEAHSCGSLSDLPAEKCTAGCDLLLIYSVKQHIIQKDLFRQLCHPGVFLP